MKLAFTTHSDKTYGDDFGTFYEPLKNIIKHIHIKDHIRGENEFELFRDGEGDIPVSD